MVWEEHYRYREDQWGELKGLLGRTNEWCLALQIAAHLGQSSSQGKAAPSSGSKRGKVFGFS